MKFQTLATTLFSVVIVVLLNNQTSTAAEISSPDGNIKLTVQPDSTGQLRYDVTFKGKPVVSSSAIGISIDGKNLGTSATLGAAKMRDFEERNTTLGNHAPRTNKGREAMISVTGGEGKTPWTLEIRMFDRGLGYRYRVPGTGKQHVDGESSDWKLPAGSKIWYQPHNARKDYEAVFTGGGLLSEFKPDQIIAAPATLQLPDGLGYATVTEANLINYTDMAVQYSGENTLKAIFHAMPQGFDWEGEVLSPWRVTLISSDLNGLVNADVIQDLCPPPSPELANADWIKPGRAAWHWMVTGGPRLNQQHQWVDWTQQIGFEYYLIDDGWNRWRDGDKDAWACMKDVVDYAKSKNVYIWAWVNCQEILTPEQREAYFTNAQKAGIVGVKMDFMDRRPGGHKDEIWWNTWYDDTLRDMARHHLMADFHGAVKPTGREKVWPNELTREAIHGREAGKQPGSHDCTLPFVRYVQGHADYTPVDFRTSATDPRAEKLKGNSFAKELAGAIIYTSPLLVFSGAPENYVANPAFDVLKAIPSTWDETIVLPSSQIGEVAAFARRKGNAWFIGVINGKEAKQITIDLKFLGSGLFKMDNLADSKERNDAWDRSEANVTSNDKIAVDMRVDGGFVVRIQAVE